MNTILCLGFDAQMWRLSDILEEYRPNWIRLTVLSDNPSVTAALADNEQWDLILCDVTAFYLLHIDKLLVNQMNRSPSLVLVRPLGSSLSPAEAFRRGAADVVTIGDQEHLLMIIEREIINAVMRKELKQLRRTLKSDIAPLPKLTKFEDFNQDPDQENPLLQEQSIEKIIPLVTTSRTEDLRIKRLIESDGLVLEYQPIVTLKLIAEQPALFEALLRLRDEDGRILRPLDFFPVASRHSWLTKLDQWVFHRALATLAHMQTQSGIMAGLFLNLATETLASDLALDAIINTIDTAAIMPGSLVIEVDKEVFSKQKAGLKRLHQILQSYQHGLLIEKFDADDGWLLDLIPNLVTHVKLNCNFLHGAIVDHETEDALRRLISCATNHHAKVIALAVDNANVLPLLYSIGVDYIQGHFVSMPYEELVYPSVHVVEI
ncbi:EAL domain-containing protein [Thiospirillum jenense]|nr:EAL domain-containing protein [Thiospirillum jenense]